MTVRTYDSIRFAAVVLNVVAMLMSVSQWSALIRVPLFVWRDPATTLVLVISLAAPMSLIALLVKPREP
jgi:tryptophan-rich sensory protein